MKGLLENKIAAVSLSALFCNSKRVVRWIQFNYLTGWCQWNVTVSGLRGNKSLIWLIDSPFLKGNNTENAPLAVRNRTREQTINKSQKFSCLFYVFILFIDFIVWFRFKTGKIYDIEWISNRLAASIVHLYVTTFNVCSSTLFFTTQLSVVHRLCC